jgi:hypothetical protein
VYPARGDKQRLSRAQINSKALPRNLSGDEVAKITNTNNELGGKRRTDDFRERIAK